MIAMVTAGVAAFFYLRVAVLMYAGGGLGEPEGGTSGSAELDIDESMVGGGTITAAAPPEIPDAGVAVPEAERPTGGGGLAWATPGSVGGAVTTLNEQILLHDELEDEDEDTAPEPVRVPALGALAIGICTGVTVLFGVLTNHFASRCQSS